VNIDLAWGALLIAKEEYPHIELDQYIRMLDSLAKNAEELLEAEHTSTEAKLNTMLHYLFEIESFQGNNDDYYDPKNSFLNDCLDRRCGIPITLSLITLEVGWRLGLPLVGIGFPGHFLVKYSGPDGEKIIDPFSKGAILTREECLTKLDQMFPMDYPHKEEYFNAISKKEILTRMLHNLKAIYVHKGHYQKALSTLDRLLMLIPLSLEDIRDRGFVLYQLERYDEARTDLEQYIGILPDAEDGEDIRDMLRILDTQDVVRP